MWSTYTIKELARKVPYVESEYLVDQFASIFLETIKYSSIFADVFQGSAPYSNDPLKKLAAAGSGYFDSVYYQVTALFQLQTKKTQHLPAPNEPLVELYDIVVDRAPHTSDIANHKAALLSGHWNNKGNSMESLALLIAEAGRHDLIITMAYLVMQLQYRSQSYPWLEEYLLP